MRIKYCTEKNTFKNCTSGDEEMKDVSEVLDMAVNAEPKRRLMGFFPGKNLARYLLGIKACNAGAIAATPTCPGVNGNGYNSYSFKVDATCVTP